MEEMDSGVTGYNEESRVIMLFGDIDENCSFAVSQGLLELQGDNPMEEIKMIINSPGGKIDDMFTIVDMMDCVAPDISTIVVRKSNERRCIYCN